MNMTQKIIYQTEDEHGIIEVKEVNTVRSLYFNSNAQQSAISLKNPDALHLAYARSMVSWLLFKEIRDDDILLMGLGGGSLAKFLLHHFPNCQIEVIEYRKTVVDIAHNYFDLPRDLRLNVVVDDGARYVKERINLQREFYDIMMLDAFDATGMAESLCNVEFFTQCKAMLKPNGILVVDLWNNKDQFEQLFRWLGKLFQAKLLFLPVHGMINVIGLFFNDETPIYQLPDLRKRAMQLEKQYRLPFKQFLKDLIQHNPNFIDYVTSK